MKSRTIAFRRPKGTRASSRVALRIWMHPRELEALERRAAAASMSLRAYVAALFESDADDLPKVKKRINWLDVGDVGKLLARRCARPVALEGGIVGCTRPIHHGGACDGAYLRPGWRFPPALPGDVDADAAARVLEAGRADPAALKAALIDELKITIPTEERSTVLRAVAIGLEQLERDATDREVAAEYEERKRTHPADCDCVECVADHAQGCDCEHCTDANENARIALEELYGAGAGTMPTGGDDGEEEE